MTGPHLTPEREAEILRIIEADRVQYGDDNAIVVALADLLAALDAERLAHTQARTALVESTELLAGLLASRAAQSIGRAAIDAQVQANQTILLAARVSAAADTDGGQT